MQIQKALDGSTGKVTDKDTVVSSQDSGLGSETCSETGTDSQEVDNEGSPDHGSHDQEEDKVKSQVEVADA